jgi:RHS repeat-associated protein
VDPATTPRVQYAYSQGSGGNHSRLTRVTYPDGYQVNYGYSGIDTAVSRPTSLSGQRAGSTSSVTLEAFKYLGAGTVIERSRPEVNVTLSMVNFSGTTADAGDKYTGLDRFGRVVDQRWTQGTTATSPVLDRYDYTYDRNSNRLTRSNALAAAFSETYAYDALNQLQCFNRGNTPTPTTSQQWQFDALGNWTTVTTNGVAQTRTANVQNELTQVGSSALAYSTTGNLTTDAEGRTLSYDAWNRLVSVRDSTGMLIARYEYDGLNRRIVEQVGTLAAPSAAAAAIRDVYYSQDWQALEERVRTSPSQVAATADTRFIWSPVYVDAMVARDRNADGNATTGTGGLEQRVYALQDANWNTTAIIAATGVPGVSAAAVINRFAYTPYGELQALTASWATPPAGSTPAVPWAHLFQGLEFTDVTGLAYVRHRDYSATLGRFIELDPIGFSAGDNNWYRFVANGPTGKVDPSGLGPCEDGFEANMLRARVERNNRLKEANQLRESALGTAYEVLDDCLDNVLLAEIVGLAACSLSLVGFPACMATVMLTVGVMGRNCYTGFEITIKSIDADHDIRFSNAMDNYKEQSDVARQELVRCKERESCR